MKVLIKVLRVFVVFVFIYVLFLFSPFTLFFQRFRTQNSISVDISSVLKKSEETFTDNIETDEICYDCRQIETSVDTGEPSEVIENDDQPSCSIDGDFTTDTFRVFQEEGFVYLEIFGEVTTKKGAEAYDYVRNQGCFTSSPNLIFLNE